MKNGKRIMIGITGLMLATGLSACGNQGKQVASSDAGKIGQEQYYDQMKKSPNGKQVLQQMLFNQLLNQKYGSKVSDSQVDAQYQEQYVRPYGGNLDNLLKQQGTSKDDIKQNIKNQLLLREAVKADTDFSADALKQQFQSYQPQVTVNSILVSSPSQAKSLIKKLDANKGKNFTDLAKKYSNDTTTKNNGGRMQPFDNTNSNIDPNLKTAAYKLADNEYTKQPVKTIYGYQIIQMVNHPKKANYTDHEDELKDQIVDQKLKDGITMQKLTAKILKQGNVKVDDSSLSNTIKQDENVPS